MWRLANSTANEAKLPWKRKILLLWYSSGKYLAGIMQNEFVYVLLPNFYVILTMQRP
jgi:hypothetical protein